jgi:hypothetical protein
MYTEAFGYPFEGDTSTKRLLVGSAIVAAYGLIYVFAALLSVIFIGFLLYPLLLVPLVLLYGYAMAVFEGTIDDVPTTPPFDDWGELATQGVRMLGLVFVYQIPLAIPVVGYIVVAVGLSAGLDPTAGDPTAQGAIGLVTILFILVMAVLSLAIAYVVPAALCSAARDHSIAAGFDLDPIKRACLDAEYAKGWVLAVLVYLTIGTLGTVLSFVLVGIPIVFYTLVVASRLIGIGYREALGVESDPPNAEGGPDGSDAEPSVTQADETTAGV